MKLSRKEMVKAILDTTSSITIEDLAYMTDHEVWVEYTIWVLGLE